MAEENQPQSGSVEEPQKQISGIIKDLQEERRSRQALEKELEEHRAQIGQYADLREELSQWRKERKSSQEAVQDDGYSSDPIGYLKREIDTHRTIIQQEMTRREEEAKRKEEETKLSRDASQQVDDYRRAHPEYDHALKYVVDQWSREFQAMGLSQYEIQSALDNQARSVMNYARSRHMNPAQLVHNIATSRGFSAPDSTDSFGQYPSERRLDRGSDSLPDRLRSISEMSDDEFDKLWARMEEEDKKAQGRGR